MVDVMRTKELFGGSVFNDGAFIRELDAVFYLARRTHFVIDMSLAINCPSLPPMPERRQRPEHSGQDKNGTWTVRRAQGRAASPASPNCSGSGRSRKFSIPKAAKNASVVTKV